VSHAALSLFNLKSLPPPPFSFPLFGTWRQDSAGVREAQFFLLGPPPLFLLPPFPFPLHRSNKSKEKSQRARALPFPSCRSPSPPLFFPFFFSPLFFFNRESMRNEQCATESIPALLFPPQPPFSSPPLFFFLPFLIDHSGGSKKKLACPIVSISPFFFFFPPYLIPHTQQERMKEKVYEGANRGVYRSFVFSGRLKILSTAFFFSSSPPSPSSPPPPSQRQKPGKRCERGNMGMITTFHSVKSPPSLLPLFFPFPPFFLAAAEDERDSLRTRLGPLAPPFSSFFSSPFL